MGTIGGAVAHADPGLDFPPALAAVEATLEIASSAGRRVVPISAFFLDWYTTILAAGEIVVAVHIRRPKPGVGLFSNTLGVAGDFAIVSVAVFLARDGEVHVAIGGCGPRPLASAEANQILSSDLSQSAAARAGDLLTSLANPVDDVRGTAEYRKVLIPRMLSRAIKDAVAASRVAA